MITLYVTPVVYVYMDRLGARIGRRKRKRAEDGSYETASSSRATTSAAL